MSINVKAIAVAVLLATAVAPAQADADVLAGIAVAPLQHRYDYRRAAFGEAWDNGTSCDERDLILDRDLNLKTYVWTKRCPNAVASGVLNDPYTGRTITFTRGPRTGEAVQIDHIVPLAYAWDMGAYAWTDEQRDRFANDPIELLAVDGTANQSKGDYPPGKWMPPNTAYDCQDATKFIAVLRTYQLPVDPASVPVLRQASTTCAPSQSS
jgi:Protein of unknown function (DUF1524)